MEILHTSEVTQQTRILSQLKDRFECNECKNVQPAHTFIYEPLEDLITWFPDKQLIHIHFGKPSWQEDISDEEAHWVYEVTGACIEHGPSPIFALSDFSHIDDSEFPTKEAIRMYGKSLGREGTAHVTSYGHSNAMGMILKMIGTVSSAARKFTMAADHDSAMKEWEEWFKTIKK